MNVAVDKKYNQYINGIKMNRNIVLEKLRKGEPTLGGWVMSNSITAAEIMAQAGFDWVCIDAEHSQISKETALNMIRAIQLYGSEPFVRISCNSEVEVKKFLDMGVRGVIIPMVKSYEDVERAISYIKYSPDGNRSFALPRCTGYGEWSADYFEKANEEILIAIMIEHIDAIRDLDSIFACKEIHAVFVGPYDLSGSMHIPGKFNDPDFISVINLINEKAKKHNVIMGYHEVHPTSDNIISLIQDGMRFIACGMDTVFLLEKSKEFASIMRKYK